MSICPICEKPLSNNYSRLHFKCIEETMALLIKDDVEYEPEPEMKPEPVIKPVREIKKPPIKPIHPVKQFKQPKPINNVKIKKSLKIIIEKEYFPLIQVSYDPNDTTIYI